MSLVGGVKAGAVRAYLGDGDDHDEAALPGTTEKRTSLRVTLFCLVEQVDGEACLRDGRGGEVRHEQPLVARLDLHLPRQPGAFEQQTIQAALQPVL